MGELFEELTDNGILLFSSRKRETVSGQRNIAGQVGHVMEVINAFYSIVIEWGWHFVSLVRAQELCIQLVFLTAQRRPFLASSPH